MFRRDGPQHVQEWLAADAIDWREVQFHLPAANAAGFTRVFAGQIPAGERAPDHQSIRSEL